MISAGGQWRSSRRAERVGDRRQAAAAVDEHGDATLRGEREDGLEPRVVRQEALRARVELDAARAEVDAAARLLDRCLVEVEADVRDELVGRRGRVGERAVVRGAERRVAIRLVEAEDERAHDPVRALDGEQLVAVADHAVDVLAEVGVRVDHRGVGRELRERERGVALEQLVRPVDRVHAVSLGTAPGHGHRRLRGALALATVL